ncbi:MAG: hypothetical protein JNM69_07955 [Archangium sp.]|nr:hypothetical protein [Archangium sp.]
MLRSILPALLVLSSGCALHHARLDSTRDLVITRQGDGLCGPIGIRRASLGARWGEYVRVSVTSPTPVTGEARLHVDGRAYPLQTFTTSPSYEAPVQVAVAVDHVSAELPAVVPLPVTTTQTIVLDAAWTNERLDVPAALGAGHVIDITLAGLRTGQGSCSDVVFTVEQGVFKPTVDERLWVAELIRRGGPELQAWLAAEEARKNEIRLQVYAEADRRRAEWQAQLAARREAERVEAIARAEAARIEVVAKVEAERTEEARREELRQAHDAAFERRKEVRVDSAVAVAPVVMPPAPKRALVCRAPRTTNATFSSGVSSGPVSSVPMVAEESCEDVVENTTVASTTVVGAGVSLTGESARTTVASTNVVTGGEVGGNVTLQGERVSSESVAAAPAMDVEAYPEWSTPTTFSSARVAVTTEQVSPPAPCPPPAPVVAPVRVTVVDPTPGLVLLHLFGAVVNAAMQAPVHPAAPVTVHPATPAAPPPPVPAARPGAP